ncbi:MAG: protein-glutamate O-methyltransferase [Deltaproteobacteria bacterium]|nr:protein-glutamate O-methyltransferase [Deltaproteobacteria bacterium]
MVPVLETPTLGDREFSLLRDLIEREAGIHLTSAKKALVVARLGRRLRALGLRSFGAYYDLVSEPGGASERVHMLDAISTNETSFFRERKHFELLEDKVLPAWREAAAAGRRSRYVHAWSAGCATGEEPYSLAMVLLRHLPPHAGWHIDILATDLSTRALDKARAGIWPIEKADTIPGEYRRAFMLRGVRAKEGTMKVGPEVRAVVRFAQLNLHADSYPVPRHCDLILCRNVLIYFDQGARARITSRLLGHLQPGGYLFLGHAETLHASCAADMRTVMPTVYVRRATESGGAGGGSG